MINTDLTIIDHCSPWMQYMAQTKTDWTRKAMKSAGWWMQQEIKKGIRSGAPGGQKYVDRMSNAKRRDIDDVMVNKDAQRKPKRNYQMLGDLVKAVGYEYKDGSVRVGWLSKGAVRIGQWQESGVTQSVTDKMRGMLFSADVGIKQGKNSIITPARPTFGPMKRVLEPQIAGYMENKIIEYMEKGAPGPAKYKRKYRVRG